MRNVLNSIPIQSTYNQRQRMVRVRWADDDGEWEWRWRIEFAFGFGLLEYFDSEHQCSVLCGKWKFENKKWEVVRCLGVVFLISLYNQFVRLFFLFDSELFNRVCLCYANFGNGHQVFEYNNSGASKMVLKSIQTHFGSFFGKKKQINTKQQINEYDNFIITLLRRAHT